MTDPRIYDTCERMRMHKQYLKELEGEELLQAVREICEDCSMQAFIQCDLTRKCHD